MSGRVLGVLRVLVAAGIVVAGARAALLFAAGDRSLPVLWTAAAAAGVAGAVASLRRPGNAALLLPLGILAAVGIADLFTRRDPPLLPVGERSFRFPEDRPFVHVMLPRDWGIEPEGTYDMPGGQGIVRRYRPQPYDSRSSPEIVVAVLRTANPAHELARAGGGVVSEAETARGGVPGRTWRTDKDGVGSLELEFRLGPWRIHWRYACRVGKFDTGQGYAQLLPAAEESAASLRFLPESPFRRLDRAWLGR
ncbi:MAG: hypothetical protein L0216_17145 [Planctomycetales bacterium]|nr:hypothetical protein [Planctomycetales bacterium]